MSPTAKNPRPRGDAGGGIDADPVVVEIEPPCRERAEIGSQAEKTAGRQSASSRRVCPGEIDDDHRGELPLRPVDCVQLIGG